MRVHTKANHVVTVDMSYMPVAASIYKVYTITLCIIDSDSMTCYIHPHTKVSVSPTAEREKGGKTRWALYWL